MTKQRLILLHTNDIHSHFEQMPHIGAIVEQYREAFPPEELLVLDIGDHMDRFSVETEGTVGKANVDIMNATGYDAIAIGNNEGLTFTMEALEEAYDGKVQFPILTGNLYKQETGEPPSWLHPYAIVRKGELRVALIGVTAAFTPFYELLGWGVRDPLETVRKYVQQLRSEADLVVVLSHLGLAMDEEMAGTIPGIDVILGGHTHHLLDPPLRIGRTLVCGAGKFGQFVGKLELEFDPARRDWACVASASLATGDFAPLPSLTVLAEQALRLGEEALGVSVAELSTALPIRWDGESPLGNLLAAGLRRITDADIGIVNAGQALAGLPAGPVTAADLHRVCPGPINPSRIMLKGKHIRLSLEEALLEEFTQKQIKGFGFRGKVLGTLCVDGLSIEYNEDRAPYHRIEQIWIGDGLLEDDTLYAVGTIDMFTFRIGYNELSEGEDVQYWLPEFLRDVLHMQLQNAEEIQASYTQRWFSSSD